MANEIDPQDETDRTERVARIQALVEQIFGSREKASLWLSTPDERIENQTPLDMLVTESGGRLVESMLWQIDEGVYSGLSGEERVKRYEALMRKFSYVQSGGPYTRDEMNER